MTEQPGREVYNPQRSDDYPTPGPIVELVRMFFGGAIDLDPATGPDNPTGALVFFTKEQDGLERSWAGYRRRFVNPPYEARWYAKIAQEVREGTETIALLKAAPCTRWHQEVILPDASAVCFVKGRLIFGGQTAPAGFGSVLVYYGGRADRFAEYFGELGWVVPGKASRRAA